MNDELEMIEEIQSDSMDELVSERKKNKAIQSFLMQSSFPVKYSLVENYPNGDSLRSEIAPEYLDELGKNKRNYFSTQKHRSDSLFYRINDIGNKFGCDTIFNSRHHKK